MNTPRGETFVVGLVAVVAIVGMILLTALGHGVEAGGVVTAAVLLAGMIRNNAKLSDVHEASQTAAENTQAMLNGELVGKIKEGFIEAMKEQGYTYTDPEAHAGRPTPPT